MEKKLNSRVLALLAIVILLLCGYALAEETSEPIASGVCGVNVSWVLDNAGTLTITGTGDMADYAYQAPWSSSYNESIKSVIVESNVTSIGSNAFYRCTNLQSVVVKSNVTSIGNYAFSQCVNLQSVILQGNSLIEIGNYAFWSCQNLTSINLPNGIISIGKNTFDGCRALESISLPNTLTTIGDSAFSGCSALTDINLPSSLISLGEAAFSSCSLKNITVPHGVTSIKKHTFSSCFNLEKIILEGNIESIGYGAFLSCYNLAELHMPNSIVLIEEAAFNRCEKLKKVTVPQLMISGGTAGGEGTLSYYFPDSPIEEVIIADGVTSIGSQAFNDCNNLISIAIPDSITHIKNAFSTCENLTYITAESVKGWLEISFSSSYANPMYYGVDLYIKDTLLTELVVPSDIESINAYAFYNCDDLVSVEFPTGVKSIGAYAFSNCESLQRISFADTLETIGSSAFYESRAIASVYAQSLEGWLELHMSTASSSPLYYGGKLYIAGNSLAGDVIIPDGISTLHFDAFRNCTDITSITLPTEITAIQSGVFSGCTGLTTVYAESLEDWLSIDFSSTPLAYASELYLADELLEGELIIPDGTTKIGRNAFYKLPAITSVTIPEGVTTIEESAFANCSALTYVYLPDSLSSITPSAFSNCAAIDSVRVPQIIITGASTAGAKGTFPYIFEGKVQEVILSPEVIYVGDRAFADCINLQSITIPEGVVSIGQLAFNNTGLTSITLPGTISTIGYRTFCDCRSLTSISIPDRVKTIEATTFLWCTALTDIKLSDNTETIGFGAFAQCQSLQSINIPASVKTIAASAFDGCASLTDVFAESLESWMNIDFESSSATPMSYAENLYIDGKILNGDIIIPEGISTIKAYTFMGWKGMTSVSIPDSVTSILSSAFSSCNNLKTVYAESLESWLGIETKGIYSSPMTYAERLYIGEKELEGRIVIPDGIDTIEYRAFRNCSGITEIVIPDSVKNIRTEAFEGCNGLNTVDAESFAGWLGIAYESESYMPMSIADTLYIGGEPLSGRIVIPDSIEVIGPYSLRNCSEITEIVIPDSVKSIRSTSFMGCTGLKIVDAESLEGWLSIAYEDDQYLPMGYAESLHIGGKELEGNIIIPDSITSIPQYALRNCTGITSVTLPAEIIVEAAAFEGCTGLYAVHTVSLEDWLSISFKSSTANPLYYAGNLFVNGTLSTDITIPDTIASISDYAFCGCASLKYLNVPRAVTSISSSAFDGCSGLTVTVIQDSCAHNWFKNSTIVSQLFVEPYTVAKGYCGRTAEWELNSAGKLAITGTGDMTIFGGTSSVPWDAYRNSISNVVIDAGITSIGNYSFQNCTKLKNIVIPDNVTEIGTWAFYGCSGLTGISIPDRVTLIGQSAFESCSGITSVYTENMESWLKITFKGIAANPLFNGATLIVNGIPSFDLVIPDGITKVNDCAFAGSDLKSVYIPDSVVTVGNNAFASCKKLTRVTLTSNLERIDSYTFSECTSLAQIVLPEGLKYIDTLAFWKCTNLKNTDLPESLLSISADAFTGCTSFTALVTEGSIAHSWCITNNVSYNLHTWVIEEAVEPTCTEDGLTEGRYCSTCGKIKSLQEIWPSSGHSEIVDLPMEPSCTKSGLTEGKHCDICGEVLVAQEVIDVLPHTEVIDETVTPTCSETGLTEGKHCDVCGEVLVAQEVIDVLPHTEVFDEAVPSTCSKTGLTEGIHCGVCGEVLVAQEIVPTIDHTPQEIPGVAASDFKDGKTAEVCCSVCGEILTAAEVIPAFCVVSSNGVLTKYTGTTANLVIPDDIGITSIGKAAFSVCKTLTSITIPEGVTSIGQQAFLSCSKLESITLPSSLTSISSEAFYNCNKLSAVFAPSLETWLGISFGNSYSNPMYFAKNLYIDGELLTQAVIPNGITSIDAFRFYNCASLTSITISPSVTSVGTSAFYGCSNLKEVRISSLESWLKYRFRDGYANPMYYADTMYVDGELLTNASLPAGITQIGAYAFYHCKDLVDIVIPESVTTIGDSAFYGCSGLTDISIPESVNSIGSSAFYSCTGLTSIRLPRDLTSLGNYAFRACSGLEKVYTPSLESWLGISFAHPESNPMYHAEELYVNGSVLTHAAIPAGTASIGAYAFYNCKTLKSVDIPDSVTSIGASAFYGNSLLKNIVIPDTVSTIGNSAFYNCNDLTGVVLPGSISAIETSTFAYCGNLKSVTIPEGVTSIGYVAFRDCFNLVNISLPTSLTTLDRSAFNNCPQSKRVVITGNKTPSYTLGSMYNFSVYCYEASAVDTWAQANGYSTSYLDTFDMSEPMSLSLSYITNTARVGEKLTLVPITFPADESFVIEWSSSKPEVATVEDGVVTALSAGYTDLTVSCGNRVTYLRINVYTPVESFNLSDNCVQIIAGNAAQININNILPSNAQTSFVIGNYNENIISTNIEDVNGITTVNITGDHPGCTTLTIIEEWSGISQSCAVVVHSEQQMTLPVNLKTIDAEAFANSPIQEVVLLEGVEFIGEQAFAGCTELMIIHMPNSVVSISEDAFEGCESVTFLCTSENTATAYAVEQGIHCIITQ